jgi:hypothetical protein
MFDIFLEANKCKKIHKIYKFLCQVLKSVMVIIFNHTKNYFPDKMNESKHFKRC